MVWERIVRASHILTRLTSRPLFWPKEDDEGGSLRFGPLEIPAEPPWGLFGGILSVVSQLDSIEVHHLHEI